MKGVYYDPLIIDVTRSTYAWDWVFPEVRWQEEILIFLGLKKRLRPIKIKRSTLFMDIIPRVKINGTGAIYRK